MISHPQQLVGHRKAVQMKIMCHTFIYMCITFPFSGPLSWSLDYLITTDSFYTENRNINLCKKNGGVTPFPFVDFFAGVQTFLRAGSMYRESQHKLVQINNDGVTPFDFLVGVRTLEVNPSSEAGSIQNITI